MSTNYYAELNFCEHCERFDRIHIGKVSAGWKFAIEIHESYYNNYKSFTEFIQRKDVKIYNENEDEVSADELLELIEAISCEKTHFKNYPEDEYKKCKEADLSKGEFS